MEVKLDIYTKANQYEKWMTNNSVDIIKNDVITASNQQDNYIVHLGYIGNYLTGTVGLGISIITLLLIFITFHNEKRKIDRQRFEDHFFYSIQNQKNNMLHMKIEKRVSNQHEDKTNLLKSGDYTAEKVILKIFREFFEINNKVKELLGDKLDNLKVARISYIILYYGLGNRSSNNLRMNGYVGDLIIFNGIHDEATHLKICNYLKDKWRIS